MNGWFIDGLGVIGWEGKSGEIMSVTVKRSRIKRLNNGGDWVLYANAFVDS